MARQSKAGDGKGKGEGKKPAKKAFGEKFKEGVVLDAQKPVEAVTPKPEPAPQPVLLKKPEVRAIKNTCLTCTHMYIKQCRRYPQFLSILRPEAHTCGEYTKL